MNIDDKDDDFDFEELDDDLGDEAWDDFDEDEEDIDKIELGIENQAPQERTFVQKYFYFIVGAVILAGIGIVALGQLVTSPARQATAPAGVLPAPETDEIAQDAGTDTEAVSDSLQSSDIQIEEPVIELDQGGNILPMPTPMKTVENQEAEALPAIDDIDFDVEFDSADDAGNPNSAVAALDAKEDVLTPMPDLSSEDPLLDENILDESIESADTTEASIEDPANDLETLSNALENFDALKKDTAVEEIAEELIFEEPVDEQPEESPATDQMDTADTDTANIADISTEPETNPLEETADTEEKIMAIEAAVENIIESTPVIEAPTNDIPVELIEKINKNEQKIDELITAIEALRSDIKEQAAQKPVMPEKTEAAPKVTTPPKKTNSTA